MSKIGVRVRDFFDVALGSKILATQYYVYRVPYPGQKAATTRFFSDATKILEHALQNHYCITLIECPFEFNFEPLLSHFGWFCEFMYFNFAETTIQFELLKKLQERALTAREKQMLLTILDKNPEPYRFGLQAYKGRTKFSLMKRETMIQKGSLQPFLARDKQFRSRLRDALFFLEPADVLPSAAISDGGVEASQADHEIENPTPADQSSRKYEPSLYGYLKFNESFSKDQDEQVITFLYDLLKDIFLRPYSLTEFAQIFYEGSSEPVVLINGPNSHKLDAQKLHLLLRKLKDQVFTASWEIVKEKLIVYDQEKRLVKSVYQISQQKISAQKARQVDKLLSPLLTALHLSGN